MSSDNKPNSNGNKPESNGNKPNMSQFVSSGNKTSPSTSTGYWATITVAYGFYFYGEIVDGPEGFLAVKNLAGSRGFSSNKGWPGVVRADPEAEVTFGLFPPDEVSLFPLHNVLAIHPTSVNLYEFAGTKIG